MSSPMNRRHFFLMAGSGIVSLGASAQEAVPPEAPETVDPDVPRIMSLFSFNKGIYYFDPAGLYVDAGQTVQWAGLQRRSVTAFHPSIDDHELRIPEGAKPFDSRKTGSGDGTFSGPSRWKAPTTIIPNLTNTWEWWAESWSANREGLVSNLQVTVIVMGGPLCTGMPDGFWSTSNQMKLSRKNGFHVPPSFCSDPFRGALIDCP